MKKNKPQLRELQSRIVTTESDDVQNDVYVCCICQAHKHARDMNTTYNDEGSSMEVCVDCLTDAANDLGLVIDSDVVSDEDFDALWEYFRDARPDPSVAVKAWAERNRFEEINTGGGCTALERVVDIDDKSYDLIVTDDASIPESVDAPCVLSLMSQDHSDPLILINVRQGLKSIDVMETTYK